MAVALHVHCVAVNKSSCDELCWCGLILRPCCRQNSLTAHLITPAKGAHFTMYLVQMKEGGKAAQLAPTVER